MAIRFAAEAWRTNLETGHPSAKDFRFYVDFRQQQYPPLDDTTTYTLITSADNQPGSHNLTGGYCNYLLDMPTSFTLALRVKPTFAYNVATDQPLVSWYVSATQYFTVLYTAADDKITVKYKDGTNERTMKSAAYANDVALQVWQDIVVVADLANSDGLLYIDRDAKASDWSAGADTKATNFPKLQLRGENGTAGAWTVNYMRLFPSVEATAAQVAADLVMLNEEIYWPLNGVAIGSTRCNVTTFVESFDYDAKVERPDNGAQCANTLSLVLRSQSGEFADDQYAAFDASASVYNGTSAQKYMQRRCPVIAEHWYSHVPEPFFVGRLDSSCFSRTSPADDLSRVTIVAEDFVSEVAREESQHGAYFEDHDLCSATESDSLVHKFVRLASQRSVKNYAANSSFENATIANSWAISGAGATLVRAAGGLFGSYQGDMDYGAATCTTAQTVTFAGERRLSVGDSYTFLVYLKSASACAYNIYLVEADSVGDNASTSAAWTLAGGDGWKRFSVTHTVTDATSDRLIMRVSADDNVLLSMDGAMLTVGKSAYNFFVLNNNDGAAGVESADDADSGTYDLIGFDVDVVAIEHPWAVIAQNETVWDPLKDIANATAAYYMGMDPAGTFRYRSPFKTGYTDPSSTLTITAGVSEVSTELAEMANAVSIKGIKIVKDTAAREVWNWDITSVKPAGGYELLSNGEVFPPTATYPEFWAQYADFTYRVERQNRDTFSSWFTGKHKKHKRVIREVSNSKDVEILGAKSMSMIYGALAGLGTASQRSTPYFDLTKSEDYTSKSTSAKIRLTNSSGSNRYLLAWTLRGLLVRRFSGEQGWVNDSHFDSESIEKNGRIEVKIANNYIVTHDQVNRLADYHWKANKTQKHSYTVSQYGTRLYYDPGEWYTLQVGGVGQREYIDSVVACESVRAHGSPSELGSTEVTLREIEQNWVFDSNTYARYLASGRLNDNTPNNALVVASSTYAGPADYYCDGTNDETEINAALLRSNHVQLTEGVFYIAAAIEMQSGCTLQGRGAGTIIEKDSNDYGIEAIGAAGTELSGVGLREFVVTATDANLNVLVFCEYSDNMVIGDVEVRDSSGFSVVDCDNFTIANCRAINCGSGFQASQGSGAFVACLADGQQGDGIGFSVTGDVVLSECSAIHYHGSSPVGFAVGSGGSNVRLNACRVNDIIDTSTGIARGIQFNGLTDCIVDSCHVSNVVSEGYDSSGDYGGFGITIGPTDCSSIAVRNCHITDCWGETDSGFIVSGKTLGGSGIEAGCGNGTFSKLIVQNNYVADCGNLIRLGSCEVAEGAGPTYYAPSFVSERTTAVTKSNATWARDNAQVHWGTYSYKFIKTVAAGTAGYVSLGDNETTTDMHVARAGEQYTLSVWVYIPTASGIAVAEVSINMDEYVGGSWTAHTTAATTLDAWEELTVNATLNASTTGFRVRITAASTAAANEYFYTDSLRLKQHGLRNDYSIQFVDNGTGTQLG